MVTDRKGKVIIVGHLTGLGDLLMYNEENMAVFLSVPDCSLVWQGFSATWGLT